MALVNRHARPASGETWELRVRLEGRGTVCLELRGEGYGRIPDGSRPLGLQLTASARGQAEVRLRLRDGLQGGGKGGDLLLGRRHTRQGGKPQSDADPSRWAANLFGSVRSSNGFRARRRPGTCASSTFLFWNDVAALCATPGKGFTLGYGRDVGSGRVLEVVQAW